MNLYHKKVYWSILCIQLSSRTKRENKQLIHFVMQGKTLLKLRNK